MNGTVLECTPHLRTAGCDMRIVYMPPGVEHELRKGTVVCVLRGGLLSQQPSGVGKSLLTRDKLMLRAGDEGCLLFVCVEQDPGAQYMDKIRGMDIQWYEYDTNMYRTLPQIHVDGYRMNLWYLGPNKEGGIHNHADELVPFVEFHTQLRGDGWMVKYADKGGSRELGRVSMEIGYTHDLFCRVTGGKATYPWHQYIAGAPGTLFIAFEDTKQATFRHLEVINRGRADVRIDE